MNIRPNSLSLWLTIFAALFLHLNSYAIVQKTNDAAASTPSVKSVKTSFENALGRKLTLKERLFLPILSKKMGKKNAAKPAEQETNGFAIASIIAVAASFLTVFLSGILVSATVFVGGLLGLAAIILGIIALSKIKKSGEKGKGLAIAGIVGGVLAIAFWIVLVIAIANAFM